MGVPEILLVVGIVLFIIFVLGVFIREVIIVPSTKTDSLDLTCEELEIKARGQSEATGYNLKDLYIDIMILKNCEI